MALKFSVIASEAISSIVSSPKSFTLAPMRGALFGKNLAFFSESVGDPQIVDSRLRGNDNYFRLLRLCLKCRLAMTSKVRLIKIV